MVNSIRIKTMALFLAIGFVSPFARPCSAADVQAQLHLRKTKYTIDENGQVWLRLIFINDGSAPIGVTAFAPARQGPWTAVNQKVEPGALVRGAIKASEGGPTVVWVDSSQGLLRFELPKRH
jgi:hypothetical protein